MAYDLAVAEPVHPTDAADGVDPAEAAETNPVEVLRRWEEFGAAWRVVAARQDEVTVALCRCDGGEEVSRITSADPRLRRWLGGRTSSER
jgi:hypothetical protein